MAKYITYQQAAIKVYSSFKGSHSKELLHNRGDLKDVKLVEGELVLDAFTSTGRRNLPVKFIKVGGNGERTQLYPDKFDIPICWFVPDWYHLFAGNQYIILQDRGSEYKGTHKGKFRERLEDQVERLAHRKPWHINW